jgi:membrane protease YdiL (CAAX protease family)
MLKRIAAFYIITLILTVALAGLQQAAGIDSRFILPQWGPGLAGLFMFLVFRRDGLSLRLNLRAAGPRRYLLALALPLAGAAVLLALVGWLLGPHGAAAAIRNLTALWIAGMLFGALGEEIGWRGYLQPLARQRWSPFATSLLVGALWAPWHIQSWANGPLYMILLVLAMIGYSLVITALIDDAPGGRVALATLFHLGINLGNVPFLPVLAAPAFMALNAAVWLVIAAVIVYLRRGRFFGPPRQVAALEFQPPSL